MEHEIISQHVASVLEIVPDVDPDHVSNLINTYLPERPDVVEHVLHILLEDPMYPKADRKGKRKRSEDNTESDQRSTPRSKIDYESKQRKTGGPEYANIAMVSRSYNVV
jgi:E3 ubiquitin-protein ligase RNF216